MKKSLIEKKLEKASEQELEYPINILDRYLEDNNLEVDTRRYQSLESFVRVEARGLLDALRLCDIGGK